MGSAFHLRIFEAGSFVEQLKLLQQKGYEIIAADLNGTDLNEHRPEKKSVIIFCNEANGPSKELEKIADTKITIPKYGKAESLNVASASAVILSHLARINY